MVADVSIVLISRCDFCRDLEARCINLDVVQAVSPIAVNTALSESNSSSGRLKSAVAPDIVCELSKCAGSRSVGVRDSCFRSCHWIACRDYLALIEWVPAAFRSGLRHCGCRIHKDSCRCSRHFTFDEICVVLAGNGRLGLFARMFRM